MIKWLPAFNNFWARNNVVEQLFLTIIYLSVIYSTRILNICAHIIEDQNPGPALSKATLPFLPTASSLSPIKRKARAIKDEPTALQEKTSDKGAAIPSGKGTI